MSAYDSVIKKLDEFIEGGRRLSSIATPEIIRFQIPSYATMKGAGGYKEESTGRTLLKSHKDEVEKLATGALFLLYEYTGGQKSVFYSQFNDRWSKIKSQNAIEGDDVKNLVRILESAREMVREGLLSLEARVATDVYGGLLDQTEKTFRKKDHRWAAILAGIILEDGLKRVAALNPQVKPVSGMHIEPISHELVKAGAITVTDRDKIVLWARIHNKAKHEAQEFKKILEKNKKDVVGMPEEVKKFLAKFLS
ncbi:MAG: hypothetical protein ACRECJ_00400 [Limisphaerales bacterium]